MPGLDSRCPISSLRASLKPWRRLLLSYPSNCSGNNGGGALSPALLTASGCGCSGILRSDECVAFIPKPRALLCFCAYSQQLARGLLDAPAARKRWRACWRPGLTSSPNAKKNRICNERRAVFGNINVDNRASHHLSQYGTRWPDASICQVLLQKNLTDFQGKPILLAAPKFMLQEHSRIIDAYHDLHVQKNELVKFYLAFVSLPLSIVALFLSLFKYIQPSAQTDSLLGALQIAAVGLAILLVFVGTSVLMIMLRIRGEQYLYVKTINATRRYFKELYGIDEHYIVLSFREHEFTFAQEEQSGRAFWEAMSGFRSRMSEGGDRGCDVAHAAPYVCFPSIGSRRGRDDSERTTRAFEYHCNHALHAYKPRFKEGGGRET
jgi:hypothetical protein